MMRLATKYTALYCTVLGLLCWFYRTRPVGTASTRDYIYCCSMLARMARVNWCVVALPPSDGATMRIARTAVVNSQ